MHSSQGFYENYIRVRDYYKHENFTWKCNQEKFTFNKCEYRMDSKGFHSFYFSKQSSRAFSESITSIYKYVCESDVNILLVSMVYRKHVRLWVFQQSQCILPSSFSSSNSCALHSMSSIYARINTNIHSGLEALHASVKPDKRQPKNTVNHFVWESVCVWLT